MDVSPTTTSYIPVTSEAHYSQVTSVGSIPANSDGNHNNTDSLPSGTQLLRTEGEVSASHTSSYDELHMVSTSTQSSSVTSSAPPEYAIATSHIQEIPHQTLGLTSIESLSPSHGNESGNQLDVPLPSEATAYQLDIHHGILSLSSQSTHQFPVLWLANTVSPGVKGSNLNTTPLPPVSEVHPSRSLKLNRSHHMSESRNDISAAPTHQLPLNDNEQQTPLHSYLTHALPNIQDSHAINLPNLGHSSAHMEVPLPPVQTTETHQSQLLSVTSEERLHPVGLISDASSAPPCLDRTPNIYSIAPSQAVTTSRSHALTSDTTVHTQLHTVMRTSGMDHHTHDLASVNHAVHYPGGLLSLTNLNLEVGLDKTHPHLQQVNLLMGSNMPLASVELSNPILNSGLIDRTSLEHNSITHETSSAPCPYNTDFHDHNDPEVCGAISCGASVGIPQMKDNHLHRDSTCNLIPTQLSVDGHALPPSMTEIGNELPGPESSSEHSHQVSVQDHDAENKDLDSLVETLACYRCKVCPFISFSKEGVEQHLRSTHLKFLEPCTELKLPGVNASKVSALETSTVQEQQSVDHNKPTADAIPAPVTSNCKDDTYICGVCEKGFPDIESCGVHMAVEHNLPVDHVQLEPLPTTTSVAVLQQPLITTPQHRSSDLPPIRPTLLPKMSSNKEQHLLTTSQQPPQPPPPPPPPPLPPPSVVPPQDNTVSKSVKKRKPKRTLRENGENDANVGVSFKKPKERKKSIVIKDETFENPSGPTDSSSSKPEMVDANILESSNDEEQKSSNSDGGLPLTLNKSSTKKRGRPRGSKSLGITALKKKNRKTKVDDDQVLGFRCDVHGCAVRMQSLENLEYHRKCHTSDPEEFECPECKEKYDNWKSMSIHLWRVHVVDMELYTCDLCSYKTYSYSKLMNMHRRIHSEERPFLCDVCGKGFKTNKQLRNHKVIHLDKRKHRSFRSGECDICHRYFSDKRMLRVHKDTVHNKLRPYLCNYCGYAASCRSTLKMHIRQHTGEKPFACEMCDYRTADHNSLRRHKMRHSGEKPYKCPFCPYACIQSSTYKTHLKNRHPGLDEGLMFCCDQCSFRTIKKENYITHVADHKNDGTSASSQVQGTSRPEVQKHENSMTTIPLHIPMQVVLPSSSTVTIQPTSTSFLQASHFKSSGTQTTTAVSMAPAMESLPSNIDHAQFIFSVSEEIKPRISQQVYEIDSDNPEERFPILASQLKLGHLNNNTDGSSNHSLTSATMETMESNRHIQIVSSQLPQEQPSHENTVEQVSVEHIPSHDTHSHEALSHTVLTPMSPVEVILPHN